MKKAPQIADVDDHEIVSPSMTKNPHGALHDALSDDPDDLWLETVLASLKGRPSEAKQALVRALLDGQDVSALLAPVTP